MVGTRSEAIPRGQIGAAAPKCHAISEIRTTCVAALAFKLLFDSHSDSMGKWNLASKRVLVADDEQSVREALKFLLGVDRYEVTEAVDGKDALALFSREHYDLVITDYAMPRMGGEELASQIKRLAPSQPIIMTTGHAEGLTGNKQTADAILAKPFALSELRNSIAKVLRLKE